MFTKAPLPLTNPFADSSVAARYEDWYAGLDTSLDGCKSVDLGPSVSISPGRCCWRLAASKALRVCKAMPWRFPLLIAVLISWL